MITIGQTWVAPSGVTYTVEAKIPGGYEVSVRAEDGPVTASNGRWDFTPAKLRNLIKAESLKLYDASAALDRISERLERKKLTVLAAALDAISTEYVTAMQPKMRLHEIEERSREQINVLLEQLKDADDPENEERILDELNTALLENENVGGEDEDQDDADTVNPVSDVDSIEPPTKISP